ncbi:retron-type reverse transcriptase [Paraburkholderia sp. WSM4175]
MYIERWLTAPFETAQGTRLQRDRGTPQGGVVSPILMNLFMHYAFDAWMQRHFPKCPFARYASSLSNVIPRYVAGGTTTGLSIGQPCMS